MEWLCLLLYNMQNLKMTIYDGQFYIMNKFTVYVLELNKIKGFYIGFSKKFIYRLWSHINGDGSIVTKTYGVKRTVYKEVIDNLLEAKKKEHELVRKYSNLGFCWGSGTSRLNKPLFNKKQFIL